MLDRSLPTAVFVVLLSLLVGSTRAQGDGGPKPLPAGPDALTRRGFDERMARFFAKALLAECRIPAAQREQCEPIVKELVSTYAESWCAFLPVGDRGTRILQLAERLRELGCDMPIVHLATADGLFDASRLDEARTAYDVARKGVEEQQCSALVRYQLRTRQWRFNAYTKRNELVRADIAACNECLVELAASPVFGAGDERFFLELVMRTWNDSVGAEDLPALERMEKAAGKPTYSLLVLRAMYHNTMAWAARGQGVASSIGAAERKTFAQELEAAAAASERAHEMCPQHPEAPTEMIKTLGPGGGGPKELRRWFDRAVAAQFDWRDAYISHMHYLQPRWGGSQRALRTFGAECLATARFDTNVPSLYRTAIHYVGLGTNDAKAVWADGEVQDALAELDRGCLAAATTDGAKRTATSHRIVALAIGGRAEEAATLSEQSKVKFDGGVCEIYGVDHAWLTKTLRPHLKNYVPPTIRSGDLFARQATAAYPGIGKAVALTKHAPSITVPLFRDGFAKWLNEIAIAAYDRGKPHDPAWDGDARGLLQRFGEIVQDGPSAADRELARKLLAGKCKHVLPLYVASRAADDQDPAKLARPLLEALPELAENHPRIFSFWIQQHASFLMSRVGQNLGGLLPRMREDLQVAIEDPMFAGDNRRIFVQAMFGADEFALANTDWMTDRGIAKLAKTKGDPWLVHVVTGLHHLGKAKHGGGSSSERSAVLALAVEHLGKAHALAPQFPEAAAGMVVAATFDAGAVSPREWFDRAVAAQIDFAPAYAAFVDSLRPRSGGSIDAMYRFALECLDSGRFDSDTPMWYARTLQRIQAEVESPREVWAAKGVAQNLRRMFEGYEKQQRRDLGAPELAAGRCVLAWAGGRYTEAVEAWHAAGKKLTPPWLEMIGHVDAALVEADLRDLDARPSKK